MRLTSYLQKQGYDLIEGPVRNHKLLQLWLKKSFDEIQPYYSQINHAFSSPVELVEEVDPSLKVNAAYKDDYKFNLGLSVLEELLKSLGLGTFQLSANLLSGKKITISYDQSLTKFVPIGAIESFLSQADFLHPNPILLRNANRNNILVINGLVAAKHLLVDIETDRKIDATLVSSLNEAAEGKLEFHHSAEGTLSMKAESDHHFPIAVKANRLRFNRGVFNGFTMISDNRNWF
jgi:hypothetical protein